jgi:LL-diaminopimelate aminotransferase
VDYTLTVDKGWKPDFEELERLEEVASGAGGGWDWRWVLQGRGGHGRIKLMWVNYPHMPTGQLPDRVV